jgi:hypothetical protein
VKLVVFNCEDFGYRKNYYKALNLITTTLGRNVYDSLASRNYSRCLA